MIKKYILENPEFIRHSRTAFRKQKLISGTNLYFFSLFILYTLIYFTMLSPNREFSLTDYAKAIYVINMGIIYIGYFYIGSYLTSNSLSIEKEKGTFDFIRMTTIERKVLAIGKLLGGSIFISYLIALNMIPISIFAFLGEIQLTHFLMVSINLLVYGLMFHTMGLFSAVTSKKVSSANSLSLAIPLLYTIVSLSFPGRTSNPFYSLFAPLNTKIAESENLSFFGVYLPAYLLIASMIIVLVYWLMKGIIKKLDSETNHIFTRSEGIKIFLIIQFFFAGFGIESIYKGETSVFVFYFYFFLAINTFISVLLSPSRDDSIIYINRKDKNESFKGLFNSKSSSSKFLILLNLLTFIISLAYYLFVIYSSKSLGFDLIIYFGLITGLFSFMYNQIFHYFSFSNSKNHIGISSFIIFLFMFIPIPIFEFNFINDPKAFDMFLLNPLFALTNFTVANIEHFNFKSLTQIIIVSTFILIMNYFIKSKKEDIIKKFKI